MAFDRHKNGSGIYRDYRRIPVPSFYFWVPNNEAAFLSEMDRFGAYCSMYMMLALNINPAILCDLIISEPVSNSLTYEYPGGKQGEIVITFTWNEVGTYTQTVRDNCI